MTLIKDTKNAILAVLATATVVAGGAVAYGGVYTPLPVSIAIGEKNIALKWTDDNSNEDLIIQSDEHEYRSSGVSTVTFSVTNKSGKDQSVKVLVTTPNDKWKVLSTRRFMGNTVIPAHKEKASATSTEETDVPEKTEAQYTAKAQGGISKKTGIARKNTPGVAKAEFQDTDTILAGDTAYYQAEIDFSDTSALGLSKTELLSAKEISAGEFFVEVFGDKGGYGHLDPSTLLTNITAYYKFDSGALTTDTVGTNTLTNVGTVGETSSGLIGYGADLGNPNTSKGFRINSTIETTYAGDKSVSFWIKLRAEPSSGNYIGLHSFQFGSNPGSSWKILYVRDPGYFLRFSLSDVGIIDVNGQLGTTNWHHLVLSEASGVITFYVDGNSAGTKTKSGGNHTVYGNWVSFGYTYNNRDTTLYSASYVDEAAVWSRALTSTEVGVLYKSGVGCQYPFTDDCASATNYSNPFDTLLFE